MKCQDIQNTDCVWSNPILVPKSSRYKEIPPRSLLGRKKGKGRKSPLGIKNREPDEGDRSFGSYNVDRLGLSVSA